MALPFTPLNIDVLDGDKNGLYPSFGSTTKISAPMVVRENGLYLAIRGMTAAPAGTPPWQDVDITTATVSASIDMPDLLPSQGTFTLTFGANTTPATAYNIGASNLQNALNALASITTAGGVTVVQTAGDDDFIVTFNANGAQALISGASVNLYPASAVTVISDQTGTTSQPSIQTLSIQQLPATFQDSFTAFPGAGYTCVILTAGGSGINNLQLFTFNPLPYAGTYTVTTAYGTSGLIAFSALGNDLQSAMEAIVGTPAGTWLVTGGASGPYGITNTTGLSIFALTANLAGLSVPVGVTGELNLATPGMVARFNSLPSGTTSFAATLEIVVQYSGQSPQTILLVPVTVMRNVINAAAIVQPPYPVGVTLAEVQAIVATLYQVAAETVSAAGSDAPTIPFYTKQFTYQITAESGSGIYTHTTHLLAANRLAGDKAFISIAFPASTNPTIEILNNAGSIIFSAIGTGVAGNASAWFTFGTDWTYDD